MGKAVHFPTKQICPPPSKKSKKTLTKKAIVFYVAVICKNSNEKFSKHSNKPSRFL